MDFSSEIKEDSVRRSVSRSLQLLNSKDRTKVYLFIGAQLCVSILDSLGVLLMGVVASLGLDFISSSKSTNSFGSYLQHFGVKEVSSEKLLPILGVGVIALLVIRTALSLLISIK